MVIEDHINLMGVNPLVGINDDRLGPRFPDMARPYDLPLIARALELGRAENVPLHKGVFVASAGAEPGNPGRVSLPAIDRGRRGGHVDRAGSDCGGACRSAGAGFFDYHRHVLA